MNQTVELIIDILVGGNVINMKGSEFYSIEQPLK